MTDVAVVGFAHAPHVRRTDGTTNGVEMLMPCFAVALRRARPEADRYRLLVFWFVGLSCRARILVHLGDRLDRRGSADQRIARRDGRGLGALRGLHQAADRPGRHRAWSTGSASPRRGRCAGCSPCRPTRTPSRRCGPTRCRSAGLQARLGLDSGKWTAEQMAQVALDSFAARRTHRSRETRVQ